MTAPRINPSWARSVLHGRGIPSFTREIVHAALQDLSDDQVVRIESLLRKAHAGTDSGSELEQLALFSRCCNPAAGASVRRLGLNGSPSSLLAAADVHPTLFDQVRLLADPAHTAAAAQTLQGWLPAAVSGIDTSEVPEVPEDPPRPAAVVIPAPPRLTSVAKSQVSKPSVSPPVPQEIERPAGHHVYAGHGALKVEPDTVRSAKTNARHTLRLEVAAKDSEGDRYAWDRKIGLQLTLRELPEFAAFVLGFVDSMEIQGHGEKNDKSMQCSHDGARLLIRIAQRGGPRSGASSGSTGVRVPVDGGDKYALAMLALAALQANAPQAPFEAILASLRSLAEPER
jgi:hypothetical protein